jgi:hypothetical protein
LETYTITGIQEADREKLRKGIYLVSLYATRIPPHIGILGEGNYHSLTVKGKDVNVSLDALLRNITQRQLPTVFIKLNAHPVFSPDFLSEDFASTLERFVRVDIGKATCLTPVKLFFEENWNLDLSAVHFLYELLPFLEKRKLVEGSYGMYMEAQLDKGAFRMPYYTLKEIHEGIEEVRSSFK